MTIPLPDPLVAKFNKEPDLGEDVDRKLSPWGVQRNLEALAIAAGEVRRLGTITETSASSTALADGATVHTVTAPVAGAYVVAGGGNFAFVGGSRRGFQLRKNGGLFAAQIVGLVSNDTTLNVSRPILLAAGDSITMTTIHDAGGSQNHNSTYLTLALVGL